MTCACPTCGAPMPDVPVEALAAAATPIGARIVRAVARRPGIGAEDLASAVYADDPDGGPDWGESVVRTVICRMNKRWSGMGYRVVAGRGSIHGYHLRRVSP